jgi:uncharacterized protein
MKANPQEQKTLLELVAADIELVKISHDKSKLLASQEIEQANASALEISDQLIDLRNKVGEYEMELKRAENDLELVETRIAKDQQRLATTSSAKDAQGIEHELSSLASRKSALEDAELAIMEELDTAKGELQVLTDTKISVDGELGRLRTELATNLSEIELKTKDLAAHRSSLMATLSSDLAAAYQRKSERGVAVGKLMGRECGACRLSITATYLDEILALPADEIAECPSCQAYLVRA